MMLTLAIFWEIAWRARNAVPDNSAALFASLIICGLLYFGAVLIIPSDAVDRKDLDAHGLQMLTIALLLISNIFMAVAWYGQLRFPN